MALEHKQGPLGEDIEEPRIIKRYANRKLYDTSRSAYVTLDNLAELIRAGEDVRVIDNRTKDDLTSVTLAQIIFEQQKTRRRAMPLSALRTIIQGPAELFQKLGNEVTHLKDEAAKQVGKLKRKTDVIDEGRQMVLEALDNLHQTLEDMQRRVDERVRDAVDALTQAPSLEREIQDLKARIERIELVIAQLVRALRLDDLLGDRNPEPRSEITEH